MPNYEYRVANIFQGPPASPSAKVEILNELANDGWRLHTVLLKGTTGMMGNVMNAIFEREVAIESEVATLNEARPSIDDLEPSKPNVAAPFSESVGVGTGREVFTKRGRGRPPKNVNT